MASTPVVIAPVVPAAPALSTAHSAEDRMANKLAAAMHANRPTPGPVVPPLAAPSTGTVPPANNSPAAPNTQVNTASVPGGLDSAPVFDLDNIDFDNPPVGGTPETAVSATPETPATPETEVKPQMTEAEIERQLGEMLAKGELPDKIEQIFLRHSRGKQMLNSFKTMRELAKPPAEGGIGRIPTLDEIRAGDFASRATVGMKEDFQNNPEAFLRNLITIDPQTGQNYFGDANHVRGLVQSFPRIIQEALQSAPDPQTRQMYGQLYSQYATPVVTTMLNHQYDQAMKMPGGVDAQGRPDDNLVMKARLLDALQMLEYRVFGKARALNVGPNAQTTPASVGADPEKVALQQQIQQLQNQNRDNNTRQAQATVTSIEQTATTGVMSDLDTLFKTANLDKAYSPEILNPLKNDLFTELSKIVGSHDPSGFQNYRLQVQQAARGQIGQEIPAQTYRQLFRNALRGNSGIRSRMATLVNGAKSSLDAYNSRLASAQNRVEPNGSGVAARGSVVPTTQLVQEKGESREEFVARRIRVASQATLPQRR